MRRAITPSLLRFATLAVMLVSLSSFAQQHKVLAPHDPIAPRVKNPKPSPTPAGPGSIASGPWIVDGNFKSVIYLKNSLETSAITITPVLYLSNGNKYPLPAVQIEASGTATVDINAALQSLGIAPYATLSGWVELQYNWPWAPICATLRDVDVIHSVIFAYGFNNPGPQSVKGKSSATAQVTEGVWWKQEKNVTGFLALANTTSQPITADIEVSDNQATVLGSHKVTISPQGMKTLDLQELQSAATTEGGIRVSYKGAADDLLINGGVEDTNSGYSANLPFAPPTRPAPPYSHALTLEAVSELGLMVGAADPMMRFPVGTTFTPYSVLRNVTANPISVTPTLWWMTSGAPASFQLPQFTVSSLETRTLDMPSLLAAAGLKNYNGSVNLVFDTQGQIGLLIAAGSVDQTNTYVFEVAPRGITKSAGKSISYWSTADGDDTMVTLWNPADEPQDFIFRLEFTGGHYSLPIHLEAHATRMFNVSDIIMTQVPDADGNIIPAAIQSGSAHIVGSQADNQAILVAVDSGVYNVRRATCYQQCTTCDGSVSYWITPNPINVYAGEEYPAAFITQWDTGEPYDLTGVASWSTDDGSIATVQSGVVEGIAGGSTTISAGYSPEPMYANNCNPYLQCPIWGGGGDSASVNVTPSISSILPSLGLVGTPVAVTITGAGFKSGATLNAGSNISVSNVNVLSPTQVTATFTPTNSSSAGGNQATTITVGGQASNSVSFYVQVPSSLTVVSAALASPNCPGSQNYGVMGDVRYQVLDQHTPGQAIQAAGMIPWETGTFWDGTPLNSQLGLASAPDGTFHDVPLGYCIGVPIPLPGRQSNQNISMNVGSSSYPVRSQTLTVTAPGSQSFGHGTLTNSTGDISISR